MLLAIKKDIASSYFLCVLCICVGVSLRCQPECFYSYWLSWNEEIRLMPLAGASVKSPSEGERESEASCTCYKIAQGDEVVSVFSRYSYSIFKRIIFASNLYARSLNDSHTHTYIRTDTKRLFCKLSCHYILYLLHTFDLISFNSRYDSDFHKIW